MKEEVPSPLPPPAPPKPGPARLRRRLVQLAVLGTLALAAGGNALAWFHARAMTRFARGVPRPKKPEDMTAREKLAALVGGVPIPRPVHWTTPGAAGLPFETERFPTDDGLTLEAWRVPAASPASETVVFFHGYAASKSQHVPAAAWFHARGDEGVLVDFRGSGGSEGEVTSLGVHEAKDVARAVEHARARDSRPPVLFGTSMGAVAILRAASELGVTPRAAVLEQPFGRLLATVEKRFGLMGIPSFPGARLLVFWGGVQLGFSGFAHEPVEYAKRVRFPVLLLAGEADPTVLPEETRELYESLAGPKRLVFFPGARHESLIKKDRAAWEAAVASFLDSLETRSP